MVSARRSAMKAPRPLATAAALTVVIASLGLLAGQAAGSTTPGSAANRAKVIAAANAAAANKSLKSAGAYHETKTIERDNLIDGKNVVVDKRTVSLSVNVTNNLIDRQILKVTWTGAHPTGGIWDNPNDSSYAQDQEYPMVLLECHGNPSPSAPAAQQIQPQDCWTSSPQERVFSSGDDFPPWRLDRYATAADQRNLDVGVPNSGCGAEAINSGYPTFWLNYVNSSGKRYPIGPDGCAGMPNEMSPLGGLSNLPSNETFAPTNLKGAGTASFDVWTSLLNGDLGCSQTVSCALVAVPIMGISCDPAAASMPPADQPSPGADEEQAAALCEETGNFAPGSLLEQGELGQQDMAVSGELWWAASNWRNRFVVPLHFAPPTDICAIVNQGNRTANIYGSELVDQAMLQWQPQFCLNKKASDRFTLNYVPESEPEAALSLATGGLATGSVEAALVTDQPATGFPGPVVHAPLAETGFAISFSIDNAQGQPVTTLRLDPRLLAKLLTDSYPGLAINETDPELLHTCYDSSVPLAGTGGQCGNPLNITDDPEFLALNPDIPKGGSGLLFQSAAAAVMLVLDDNSDVINALTSYINSNPAARAFLAGKPDPWGMVVNSAYKGKTLTLPTPEWPLLSTYIPQSWITDPQGAGPGFCYSVNPTPVFTLLDSPVSSLALIAQDVQFEQEQAQTQCSPGGNPQIPQSEHLIAYGQQPAGYYFMIGVTTLADAERYGLDTASLLTYTKPGTPAAFTSTAGMTFISPTSTGLRDAAALLQPDKATHTWNFPYGLYNQDSTKAEHAYPGAMLVYADVPTKGLTHAIAKDYSQLVSFAGTKGQAPGGAVGQLPQGYLPMTTANHLGEERAYAASAASAIADQKGAIPALIPAKSAKKPGSTTSPGTGTGTGTGTSTSSSPGAGSTSSASPPPAGDTSPSPSPSSTRQKLTLTPEANFGLAGYALPAMAGLALLAAAAAGVIAWLTRTKGKRWWG